MQHELNHVAVEMHVTRAVTAVEHDVASSTTPQASLIQKHEREPLLLRRHGPYSVQGVSTPFSD